ncbi:MAG: sulfatase-like hydrolase/transferase [Candidatus Buchananbacteria bacterium]|nr:sulfatase-like hydrolase/transferase [Candidatus Buchananbacteria bacterium]
MKKILIKSLFLSILLTVISVGIFLWNVKLDSNLVNFVNTFKFPTFDINYFFILKIICLHLLLFFILFIFSYCVCDKIYKKTSRKINIFWLITPFISLVVARSIITEPFLYQVFYDSSDIFRLILNTLLYFNIRLILDVVIIGIIILALVWILKFYSFLVFLLIIGYFLFYNNTLLFFNNIENNETVIIIMNDSLRKDVVENNHDLFLNKIYNQSTVLDNMYTVFPASVPTLASIFSNEYPYKYRTTAMSVDNQIDLTFINQLGKEYLISLHTDFTDDDIINRVNFNIPFSEVSAPYISYTTAFDANILKKDVVLLAFVFNNTIRNLLIPEYFQSDNNANSRNSVNLFVRYLNQHRQDRKIAFLSLGDAHVPFEAKYPYYRFFLSNVNNNKYNWIFDYQDYKYNGDNLISNQNIRNLYMMDVFSLDSEIKYLFEKLDSLRLLTNSKIVLMADQGESIYDNDLNLLSHNNLDSKHVLNVPFFIYELGKVPSLVEGNYALIDTINLALYPNKIPDYARDFIYMESDMDIHNTSSSLYVDNFGTILDVSDMSSMKIIDNNLLQKYKKRALVYKNYILVYKPEFKDIYSLYNLEYDPLFQNDVKKNNLDIFNMMKLKLDDFIEDTKGY